MREIKFRIWNRDLQEMMFPDQGYVLGFGEKHVDFFEPDNCEAAAWGQEDFEIMQFTGLLDKNKKEVYEGDILLYFLTDSDGNKTDSKVSGEVYMNEYGFWTAKGLGGINFTACEIIGNVFENPELLK